MCVWGCINSGSGNDSRGSDDDDDDAVIIIIVVVVVVVVVVVLRCLFRSDWVFKNIQDHLSFQATCKEAWRPNLCVNDNLWLFSYDLFKHSVHTAVGSVGVSV